MSKYTTRLLITAFTFVIGIWVVAAWFYLGSSREGNVALSVATSEPQELETFISSEPWEPIFFRLIDKTTKLGGLKELRKTTLSNGDIEIRVWRGFGLADFEGVVLKRTGDQWKAFHVKADDYAEPRAVKVGELKPRKSGWELFWRNLTEQGLLTLRDPAEMSCEDSSRDGTHYVVEINQNNTYRTYQMGERGECPGARQMETIDDLIGEEFDSGQEECKRAEWFACAKVRKLERK